jgi:hypothetical protein
MTCDVCGSGKCHDIRGFNFADETFYVCFFCIKNTDKCMDKMEDYYDYA